MLRFIFSLKVSATIVRGLSKETYRIQQRFDSRESRCDFFLFLLLMKEKVLFVADFLLEQMKRPSIIKMFAPKPSGDGLERVAVVRRSMLIIGVVTRRYRRCYGRSREFICKLPAFQHSPLCARRASEVSDSEHFIFHTTDFTLISYRHQLLCYFTLRTELDRFKLTVVLASSVASGYNRGL